ncbi:MAG: hypothetical protein IT364_27910 [Candidatus Hydrogenedentes bacterium]|nr:hypothetical protein [Candidatus Hydrogenedentota bacterium]
MDYIIRYIELKSSCHTDADEAWIARVWPSSSGKTIYFNGMALKRTTGTIDSNHYDLATGDLYWVSGVKKRGTNRHWGGPIYIEESLLPWYEKHTNGKCPTEVVPRRDLPKPDISRFHALENEAFGLANNTNQPPGTARA